MTFIDYETSVERSQPREAIQIELPTVTYRIATGTRDLVLDGQRFTASPANRADLNVAIGGADGSTDLIVVLPITHAVCQRYLRGGVPPKQCVVTVYRIQLGDPDNTIETLWRGEVLSLEVDKHTGKLRVPSRMARTMLRRLPSLTGGRGCPHILYAENTCKVDRSLFRVDATIATMNGRAMTLSTIGGKPDRWAEGGEVVHVSSGERMTVISQVGTLVTAQLAIPGLALGDAVELYAGCAHDVVTCRDTFANVDNYGGFPNLPAQPQNPFRPDGFGLATSA